MKCDRKWYRDGRHERVCRAWEAWFRARPQWSFMMDADGEIYGAYRPPLEDWQREEPK